jgi:hypothetical protein
MFMTEKCTCVLGGYVLLFLQDCKLMELVWGLHVYTAFIIGPLLGLT